MRIIHFATKLKRPGVPSTTNTVKKSPGSSHFETFGFTTLMGGPPRNE